ncbi:MAG: efflux transporter outer membrane subunit [Paucibacter sp.]|nr:efflux transporter outer membrane subunit [Roseateles sp.]
MSSSLQFIRQALAIRWRPTVLALAGAAALAGCAVGPDFKRPEAPAAASYGVNEGLTPGAGVMGAGSGEPQQFKSADDLPFDWWKSFGSPDLDAVVERALRASPTVTAAQANLRQAQEMVYAQQGYFFPTVGLNYNFERQKLAGNQGGNSPGIQGDGSTIQTYQNPGGPTPFNGPVLYNFHTAQLTVGYTPDVFGANRRQVESLDAQAKMAQFQLEATYITLVSNVVAACIQEASVRAQMDAIHLLIDDNQKALDILNMQFKNGFVMRMDVAAQESLLAQAKVLLPPLQKQLEQTRDLIRALVGNMPGEEISQTFSLDRLHMPAELPLSLPSKIVDQRPDVRAALEQLRSANAQVGVAMAARLPQFSITGAIGGTASHFNEMFKTGGPFWNIIAGVSQTVFDGNTLKHRQRAAEQGLLQAAEQYRGTVIAAYQNVADTLHAIRGDADAYDAALDAEHAAKVTLDLTRLQEQVGFANHQAFLSAEIAYQQALLALVQARAQRFGDTAALFQALGGGWWNRPVVVATADDENAKEAPKPLPLRP